MPPEGPCPPPCLTCVRGPAASRVASQGLSQHGAPFRLCVSHCNTQGLEATEELAVGVIWEHCAWVSLGQAGRWSAAGRSHEDSQAGCMGKVPPKGQAGLGCGDVKEGMRLEEGV